MFSKHFIHKKIKIRITVTFLILKTLEKLQKMHNWKNKNKDLSKKKTRKKRNKDLKVLTQLEDKN